MNPLIDQLEARVRQSVQAAKDAAVIIDDLRAVNGELRRAVEAARSERDQLAQLMLASESEMRGPASAWPLAVQLSVSVLLAKLRRAIGIGGARVACVGRLRLVTNSTTEKIQ